MIFELPDAVATRIRSDLVQRKRELEERYKRLNDGRRIKGWRASEIAMAKASVSLELEGIEALQAALRTPDCNPNTPHAQTLRVAADTLKRVQDALGTGETGEGLVTVARNAHTAEQQAAAAVKLLRDSEVGEDVVPKLYEILGA